MSCVFGKQFDLGTVNFVHWELTCYWYNKLIMGNILHYWNSQMPLKIELSNCRCPLKRSWSLTRPLVRIGGLVGPINVANIKSATSVLFCEQNDYEWPSLKMDIECKNRWWSLIIQKLKKMLNEIRQKVQEIIAPSTNKRIMLIL